MTQKTFISTYLVPVFMSGNGFMLMTAVYGE